MPLVLISSVVVGSLLLLFLAYQDYCNQIFKPRKVGAYYTGLFIFIFINLFIYFALCAFFLGIDVLKADAIIASLRNEGTSPTRVLQPLILALLYHGTGMVVFKLGGKDVNLYKLLLQSFREFLKLKFASSIQIRESIAQAKAKLKMLRDKASCLRSEAVRREWDTLSDLWREMDDDLQLMETQSEYLEALKETLEEIKNDPKGSAKLDKVAHEIEGRVSTIQERQIKKLKQFLSDFALRNFKNEEEIQKLLKDLDAPQPLIPPTEPRFALRCMFVGMSFGLIFGPIFALTEGSSAVDYARFGALSVGTFGFSLGLIRDMRRRPKDRLIRAIVSGAIAGLIGHITWNFVTGLQNVLTSIEIGIAFGISLSLLVYLFRRMYCFHDVVLPDWMKSMIARYLMTAAAGAGVFAGLGIAFEPAIAQEPKAIVRLLILGVIVMWALAAGFRLFEKPGQSSHNSDESFRAHRASG